MGKVYINIHPTYGYSTIIISDYIDLTEYIKNLEWASWMMKKREIRVFGEGDGGCHLERINVFAQMLFNGGHEVLVRDSRSDKWKAFEDKGYSEEFLYKVNCEQCRFGDNQQLEDIRTYIAKVEGKIKSFQELGREAPESYLQDISEYKETETALLLREEYRLHQLKTIDSWLICQS